MTDTELLEKVRAIVEKWKDHFDSDILGGHESECCVGELVAELDKALRGLW